MPDIQVPRRFLALHATTVGAGYLLGPDSWSSGGTFAVIRDLGIPIRVWGAAFVAAGLLLFLRHRTVGHVTALAAFTFWGAGLAVTLFTGQATGYGGPVHVAFIAGVHALALWQQRTRTRAGGEHVTP